MIDNGDLHDINRTMLGLELDADSATLETEERKYRRGMYRCAALQGLLASGANHTHAWLVDAACDLGDQMLAREL